MMYQYPNHFTYPENTKIFFSDHIPLWENFFTEFKTKPNVCLEIGALYGGSSVYILDEFCKMEGSHHYIVDINTNEYIQNNIYPYRDRVSYFLGESADYFKLFEHKGKTKEFLDFIYIDGNHMSKYVLEDAVNSFYCLKENGIMVFDDFAGGLEQPKHLQVKTAVDSFIHSYEKHIDVIHVGYQLIIRKNNKVEIGDYKSNYYK